MQHFVVLFYVSLFAIVWYFAKIEGADILLQEDWLHWVTYAILCCVLFCVAIILVWCINGNRPAGGHLERKDASVNEPTREC